MHLLPEIKTETVQNEREVRAKDLIQVFDSIKRNEAGTFTVQSQWKPGSSYNVRLSLAGNGNCDCRDFQYRGRYGPCKHIIAALQWIAEER